MERAADPSPALHPQPLPGEAGDPHEPGPSGEVRTDGHSPTPASSFVCCAGALPGRWELGAGRAGEGRSRQRPLGACGHRLSQPRAGFAPQGHQEATGLGGCSWFRIPVSPRPFLPSRGSDPHHGERPSTAWVWHWGFLGYPGSSGSAPCGHLTLHGSSPHCLLGAQQVPLATARVPPATPKRPWGAGRGGLGVSWAQGGLWLPWGCN